MARVQTRPRTPTQVLRDLDDRLRVLEHRTSVVVGVAPDAFVLEVDGSGRLTARHAMTGTVTIVALP
ncbi:hypothetical protein [Streptosporangium sp. NPDC002721]|uniref:hypothetical protein n=1 Tax=Streptosporangium sp. NPDC002721 TaxID=3366188 RepID=UPI003679EBD0